MKRVCGILFLALCIFSIYFDLTFGTLPEAVGNSQEPEPVPYAEVTAKPGDTVLSMIEDIEGFPTGVSIDQMIQDFVDLNGIYPEQIQPGITYKIPIYPAGQP